ncbi:MAG: hypothetical protein M3M87_05065 [Thermoproteota archaeon]|nr:hypothetical protein [Thermoproteota archaeon]
MGLLELIEHEESHYNNVGCICIDTSLAFYLIFPNQEMKTEELAVTNNGPAPKNTIITATPHDVPKTYFVIHKLVILSLWPPC